MFKRFYPKLDWLTKTSLKSSSCLVCPCFVRGIAVKCLQSVYKCTSYTTALANPDRVKIWKAAAHIFLWISNNTHKLAKNTCKNMVRIMMNNLLSCCWICQNNDALEELKVEGGCLITKSVLRKSVGCFSRSLVFEHLGCLLFSGQECQLPG